MSKSKTTKQKTTPSLPPPPRELFLGTDTAGRPQQAIISTHIFSPEPEQRGKTSKDQFAPQSVHGKWAFGNSPLSLCLNVTTETRGEPSQPLPHLRSKDNFPLPTEGMLTEGMLTASGSSAPPGFYMWQTDVTVISARRRCKEQNVLSVVDGKCLLWTGELQKIMPHPRGAL